jgi:hypothetical protein
VPWCAAKSGGEVIARVDHLVVGAPGLRSGIRWVEERVGVAPVEGGAHEGMGTHNALLGLGDHYLEVLAPDPGQPTATSSVVEQLRVLEVPVLLTIAVASSGLSNPVQMSRRRPDGVLLEWQLEFTSTPLFFIDWMGTPRPAGLPDGGRITSLRVTTPEPDQLRGVDGVQVQQGPWHVEASVNETPLS